MESKSGFKPLEIGSYVSGNEVRETVSQALEFGLDVTLNLGNNERSLRGPKVGSLIEIIPDRPTYQVSIGIYEELTPIQKIYYHPSDQIYKVSYSSN